MGGSCRGGYRDCDKIGDRADSEESAFENRKGAECGFQADAVGIVSAHRCIAPNSDIMRI